MMKTNREISIELLKLARRKFQEAHEELMKSICIAHDNDGLTFQEIAEAVGRSSKSGVYHIYQRGKEKGY